MKVFVTGASGTLGETLIPQIQHKGWKPIPTGRGDRRFKNWIRCNINNNSALHRVISKTDPDVIVHLAAQTDVDKCEKHPNDCMQTNVLATKQIAQLCKKMSIPLIFLSTGAVFSGNKKNPYKEKDKPNPINAYGLSKYRAELAVKKVPQHLIIRTGWLIGGKSRDKKFVGGVLRQIKKGATELYGVKNVYGSPTLANELSKIICTFIDKKARGLFHVANSGVASRFQIVKFITSLLRQSKISVKPVPFGFFHEVAPRPKMEALDTNKVKDMYNVSLPLWRKSLEKYIKELQKI